ncbi:MAG TPA: response regulator [Anaerolineaceae bacterium]|nr:response regulator [Anaerolineaceae bacterium]HPN51910.1 response regulator [Anaerolineaceae bacterium]
MGSRILAVDDNLVNLKVIAATLAQAGFEVFTAESGPKALAKVNDIRPDLIILDVMMPEMDGYEVCRRLRANPVTARLPIVMLTANDTLEEKIKGFEAGADDYITKPFQPAELQARIKAQMRRGSTAAEAAREDAAAALQGRAIGVFSLRGGVGVSSLAANLAVGLAQIWSKPVALTDLVLTAGQDALMLNLPLRNTWADLAPIPVPELDADLVHDVMTRHPSGVNLLAAPRKPEQGELINGEKVAMVMKHLKSSHHYLVMDLPHDFRETTLAGLDATDIILLVMSPELASIRAAATALEVFDTLGYPRSKVRPIINWTFEKRGLARKDIETALKLTVDLVIPFSPEAFVNGINFGTPPIAAAPSSPLGVLLEDYCYNLSTDEHKQSAPASPSEAWQRVTIRNKQTRH